MYAADDMMPLWLTKTEAAEIARVSPRTIDNWIRWGWLRAGGTTRLIRIKPEWLDECLETRHDHDLDE